MRFEPDNSFGYPVLRPDNDDYIGCAIQSSINAAADTSLSQITVTYLIKISAPEIIQLIADGKASLLLYGECRDTWFDITHYPVSNEGAFVIDKGLIDGLFVLTCLVVAKEDIPKFSSVKFNPEYGGATFDISLGEIIAFDHTQTFYISRDSFRNVTSLFDYSENINLAMGEWDLVIDDDRIKVQVHPNQLPLLRSAEGTSKNKAVLLSGIFLPVLVHILNEMDRDEGEYSELKWFQVIEQKRSGLPHSLGKNPVRAAQALLKQPLYRLNNAMGWVDEN